MEEPETQTVPYFYFHHLRSKNSLRLIIFYESPADIEDVRFEPETNEVLFLSGCYKDVKILLPVDVIVAEGCDNRLIKYDERCYHFEWQLKEEHEEIKDLELITPYLSWREHAIREEPDSLTTKAPDCEDVVECLTALHLNNDERSSVGSYGFANRYTKAELPVEASAVDVPDLENSDMNARTLLRREAERQAFDFEHYLSDFFLEQLDDEDDSPFRIREAVLCVPYWYEVDPPTKYYLTSSDMEILAVLPCKNFNLSRRERLNVLHSLLDIILAYAYDHRLTDGITCCESAWNISKLSATLSWFQVHRDVGDAVNSFFRRSLAYPLCRFWLLSKLVLEDAIKIFRLGRRQILNCLIEIYTIFENDEDKQFLNKLYIEDYMIWIQQVNPITIQNYVAQILSCDGIKKEDVFWPLVRLENTAIADLKQDEENYNSWVRRYTFLSESIVEQRENPRCELSSVDPSSDSNDSLSNSDDSSSDSDSDLSKSDHEESSVDPSSDSDDSVSRSVGLTPNSHIDFSKSDHEERVLLKCSSDSDINLSKSDHKESAVDPSSDSDDSLSRSDVSEFSD